MNAADEAIGSVFTGHALQLSWLTKAEARHFSRFGNLLSPKPMGPWGSFEHVIGVDALNADRTDLDQADRYSSFYLATNWYANSSLKFSAQWRYLDASVASSSASTGNSQAARIRAQLTL